MRMDVEELDGGVTKIRLIGDLDAKGAGEIEVSFTAVTSSRLKVIVDLTGVAFLASIGIRSLISAAKTLARRGGKLVIQDPSEAVNTVLLTCGVESLIPIVQGADAASAAVAA